MKARHPKYVLVRDLNRGQHAIHCGCYQKQVGKDQYGNPLFIVLPTKTADIDRGRRFIHFGDHSFIPGEGEAIFGLNDVVEV